MLVDPFKPDSPCGVCRRPTPCFPHSVANQYAHSNNSVNNNSLIIGAGENGVILKRSFYSNSNYNIVGFIDDDTSKIGRSIDGVLVYNFNNN